ncbi:tetratricopeptide-like helical domain-containing protein [Artemisia annua]|uniref:Tetratricopeptide-like helical domain-containing protein n=1 Tax=Artemisia annua TaxID=35608 RepID=A0A2U1P1L9_ARTAN|nr:tetratricopeptide-like helical domain-containing protein [Artemisia annua]
MPKIHISHLLKFSFNFRKLHSDSNYLYKCNSKITTCFKNGDIKGAHKVFDKMPVKNIVTWNCMLSGYVKNGMVYNARKVFDEMPNRNVVSWTAMLNGYAKCGRVDEARGLFDAMSDKNVVCWNAMLSGYVKNGWINEAKRLFDEIPEKNAVSWASIIEGCFGQGSVEDAEKLFRTCPFEDVLVNNAMLAVYVEMGDIKLAWKLFSGMRERDVASWTCVIRCFMRSGEMDKARELFEEMPTKDVVAWTVMIRGFLGNNKIAEARKLFDEMPKRDVVAWNSMIGGYVKNGSLEEALKLFKNMPKCNVVSWNTILQGYVQNYDMIKARNFFDKILVKDQTTWNIMICGFQSDEALDFYSQMLQSGMRPDQVTFTGLVSVCGSLAVHGWGKAMHSCVIKYAYVNDSMIVSSLISMYSKCGFMGDANIVFETTIKKDTVAWNAMIVAQAYQGSANKAVKLFSSMIESGYKPDGLTFLGLLTGCAHSGMVKESWEIFKSMKTDWNINPTADHYSCMIDILGRTGMLTEAYELVKQLPIELPSYTWETLLSCCKVHENFELGELVAQKLSNACDLDSGMCVLHSNIYAARGMWEDAANIRTSLARRGVKKDLGCSWIELKGRVFSFVYNDRSHIQLEELHKALESLSAAMEIYS